MKKERNKEWLSMKERKTPQSGFYIRRAVLGMVSPKIIAQEIRQLGAGNEMSGAVVAQWWRIDDAVHCGLQQTRIET